MRRALSGVLLKDGPVLAVLTLVGLIAVGIVCQAEFHEAPHVYVVIGRGISFSEIGQRFESNGLVRDRLLFLMLGRIFGIERRARAGRYRFAAASNMIDILNTLYRGATYRERVLVRPGNTIDGIGEILSQRAAIDSVTFVSLCRDSALITNLGIPSVTAEGYLFPDTYDIEWQEAPETVMRRMVSTFFKAFDDSLTARAAQMGMTVNEVVTLASIIEKEAMRDEERPRISAVFHNRLERGMKLQADPTVRYALNKWKGRMLYQDLTVDSPFNTYKVYGLPPHPICSPGLPSLLAALHPIPRSNELYFVAQGDGSHHFSANAGEHQRAKVRYKDYLKKLAAERANSAAVGGEKTSPVETESGDGVQRVESEPKKERADK